MPTRSKQFKIKSDKKRPTWQKLYNDPLWIAYRKDFMERKENLFCACGCGEVSAHLDHIIPFRGSLELFWNPKNHQALAHRCHSVKTNRENYELRNEKTPRT